MQLYVQEFLSHFLSLITVFWKLKMEDLSPLWKVPPTAIVPVLVSKTQNIIFVIIFDFTD